MQVWRFDLGCYHALVLLRWGSDALSRGGFRAVPAHGPIARTGGLGVGV